MKNKSKTYILLLAVFLVWGLIGYRIYKAVKPSIPKIATNTKVTAFKPFALNKKDTFSIVANYRDPFLGTFATNKKRHHTKKATKKKTEVKPEKAKKIVFPNIKYKGIISPKSRFDQRFILKINSKTILFKLLETHQEIQLLQGNEKEIVVLYKGEQKAITLH